MLNSATIRASLLKTFKIKSHYACKPLSRDTTFGFQTTFCKTKVIIIKVTLVFAHFPIQLCLEKIYFKFIQQNINV